jgi:hypothetical protein
MSETSAEYQARLDEMIKLGKLKAEYKDILLEIDEFVSKACDLGLIYGLGWGEDANHAVKDEYEILDKNGVFLYLTLSEARDYLHNLIENPEQIF